ncbi:hypothetical protein MRX96_035383 [Rhipicephalus microplus]
MRPPRGQAQPKNEYVACGGGQVPGRKLFSTEVISTTRGLSCDTDPRAVSSARPQPDAVFARVYAEFLAVECTLGGARFLICTRNASQATRLMVAEGFRVNGENVPVEAVGPPVTYVNAYRYPAYLSDEVLSNALAQYGKVRGISFATVATRQNKLNGVPLLRTRPPWEGDVPGCACPFGGAPAAAADRRSFPFLDVGRGGPADPGGLGRPGWPWRPPDAGRRSVRVYSSFLCLALRLLPAACPARSSPPADDVIGHGHHRDRTAVVAHRPAHLVLPGPAVAVRSCCLPGPPPWILPAQVPRGAVVPGGATLLPLLAPRHHPPPQRPRRGTPGSPATGPSSPASTASHSSGPAGSEAPASSRPSAPVQPRQPALDGDVLWVYLPAPAELQCPVDNCSMKYSGAAWTSRAQSVRRHVEFEHGVRVRERIYVCAVCDAPLTSRPSYHHCLARATLVLSTETPRRRCGVCDATFMTKRGLANHLRCHVDQAGPSGAARERAPTRRVRHVSTSSDTSSSGSGSSSPPAAPRASRRLRGLSPSDAASPVRPSSSPAASGSSTSVGSASVPGSPAPSPAASPAPSEQPLRDAGGTSSPTPYIGVPTPAGVPVALPVLGSPRSPDPASPQRTPSSARQVLVPYDFGPSSSSNGASPAPLGSSAASPVGDAAFLLDDDDTISYDVAVSSPPLDAGSSPVVLPGSPVSSASSSSPPASVDEAAADPDDVQERPESDPATLRMPPDHTRLLEDQARLLRSLLRDPPTDESWAQCEEAWTRAVALAVEAVRLPPVRPGRQRRQPDPTNAVDIQRLYRRNRRRAVRLILEGPPQTCAIPLQDLQDHWGRTWSARQADSTLLLGREPAPAGSRYDQLFTGRAAH